jgi:hypothetical protein
MCLSNGCMMLPMRWASLMINWIKYSGLWVGLVANPFHWRFGFVSGSDVWNDPVFENCLHLGPVWIRVIIDDGRW